MASSLGELFVSITADASGMTSTLSSVTSQLNTFSSKMDQIGSSLKGFGTTMSLYVTAPLAAMGALSLNTAVDFDDSMRMVQAVTGETGEGFQRMTDFAMELGAETAFSSSQAADAMLQLGQAGFTTEQIMASTSDVLSLASAGALDLGVSAGITANAMNGFGLTANDTQRVVDVLAKGASISTTNIEGLGTALSYVAPVAHSMGMSIEETTSLIAALSNAGIEGERAGTSLRGAISALASPTDQMAVIFGKYNIALDKVNPATNSFTEILKTLTAAGMTSSDVMAIFGREAGPGVLALLSQGTGAIEAQTIALQNSTGAALEMAETMEGGAGGAIRQLTGSLETLQITVGNLIAVALTPLINRATEMFNQLSALPEPALKIVVALAGVVAAIGPLLVIMGTLISSAGVVASALGYAGLGGAVSALGPMLLNVVAIITGPVGIALAALAAAAYIVYKNWDVIGPMVQRTFNTIVEAVRPTAIVIQNFVSQTLEQLRAWWATNGPAIMQAAGRIADFLISAFGAMAAAILYFTSGPLKGLWAAFQQAVDIIIPILQYIGRQVGEMIMLVVNLINGNWSGAWQNAGNIVTNYVNFMRTILTAMGSFILGILSNIASNWLNSWNNLLTSARNVLQNIYNAISSTMSSIVSMLVSAVSNMTSSWTGGWNGLLNASRNVLNSILSIVTSILNSIISAFTNAVSRITSSWSTGLGGLAGIASAAMRGAASALSSAGSTLYASAASAAQQAVNGAASKLSQMQNVYNQYKMLQTGLAGLAAAQAAAGSSGGSSGSGGGTGIKRQGQDGTGEENVKIREAHATGGVAGYTGWHWMEKNELAVPAGYDWESMLIAPITASLAKAGRMTASAVRTGSLSGGAGSVQNSYGGDTFNFNGPITMSKDYDLEKLIADADRIRTKKRFQMGLST